MAYHMLTLERQWLWNARPPGGRIQGKEFQDQDSSKNSGEAPEPRSKARSQAKEPTGQSKAKAMPTVLLGFVSKPGGLGWGQKCQG